MPTRVLRRYLPSARRACASLVASGLIFGLATTAYAAPALAGNPPATVAPTVTESLDSSFVQEGMPSSHGGQVVGWGSQGGPLDGTSPRALPAGVYAVGLSTAEHQVLVLRSDGRVDSHEYDLSGGNVRHLVPPQGTSFTAVSADRFGGEQILRSDGVVVDASGEPTRTPPVGLKYTSISSHIALRSDGTLDPASVPGETCPEMRDPGAGLRYTAVTARPGGGSWAVLRSDGAFVYCDVLAEGWETKVVAPPAGTTFIGIDMGDQGEAVGATADGRIVSSSGTQLASASAGRSIVSLTAMGVGQGAAVLDDGSILSWGLRNDDAAPPLVPAGREVFSAVSGYNGYGQHWAIVVGDPIPVKVSLDPMLPTDRPLRVTDSVRVGVAATLADGTPIAGQAETTVRSPDGQTHALGEPLSMWPSDQAELNFRPAQHEQIGTHTLSVTYSSSPYVTTTVETSFAFVEPSPVELTTSGPTTWHQGTERTLCFRLATEDGSSLWWTRYGQATMSVEGDPGSVYELNYSSEGSPAESCMWALDLRPGTYTAHFDYDSWGDVDSASWTGQVVVLPPAVTRIESDLPSSWRYGQMPDFVGVDVLADSLVPVGDVHLELDGMWFGSGMYLDENGHGQIPIGHVRDLAPGTHSLFVKYRGGHGFLASSLQRTVTVKPALFTTTATPTITGTAKVGETLTATPGTWSPVPASYRYAWMVDGVAVTDATTSTFTVPASAAGKAITAKVTGLKQHYATTSTTSTPTAAVAPGTFTAPQPTITGTAKVGRTLTVSRGTWSPTPSSFTHTWKADGVTISTRTTSKFVVPASARGKRLTVTVTGSLAGYTKKSVTSGATVTVAPGTFTAPQPTIAGTTRVGSTLTVSRGTWSPAPSSVKYVWKANGTTISTRTDSRFVIPAQARGKRLTVTVVGARTGYTVKSVVSDQTSEIR